MKFRNPWIDPRVEQVRAGSLQAYLLRHGWTVTAQGPGHLQSFERASGTDGPVVLVPLAEGGRDYVQRVIDALAELANAESRYAVDVLNDVLQTAPEAPSANGPAVALPAQRPV